MDKSKFGILIIVLFAKFFCIGHEALSRPLYPVPLDKQLKMTDFVVEGTYIGHSFKKNSVTNEVETEHYFKLENIAGIKQSELINSLKFTVITSGGVWRGQRYLPYRGVIDYFNGGKYLLLLKKSPFGIKVINKGIGKYIILGRKGNRYIKSLAFPDHKVLGRIKYSYIEDLIRVNFGHHLNAVISDKYIYKGPAQKLEDGRTVASLDESSSSSKGEMSILWPILFLAILGAYTTHILPRK